MVSAIEIKNLSYSYLDGIKKVLAVNNVSLNIETNSSVALMGINGAGKTTLIKCILDFLSPQKGEISIFGKKSVDSTSRTELSYLPEKVNLTPELKLFEHFRFLGKLYKISNAETNERMKKLSALTKLENLYETRVGKFSKGQSQRAGIALSLFNEPKLLILDEPMTGLDPLGQKLIIDILNELKNKMTLFVSTHSFEFARKLADKIIIIHKGAAASELTNKKDIQDIENNFYKAVNIE